MPRYRFRNSLMLENVQIKHIVARGTATFSFATRTETPQSVYTYVRFSYVYTSVIRKRVERINDRIHDFFVFLTAKTAKNISRSHICYFFRFCTMSIFLS